MKTTENQALPSPAECQSSLKNVIDAMYVLNGRWKLPLILCLINNPKRFGELQREMEGISPKVLSNELKSLELNFFIERKVYPTTPVTITYEATEYTRTLKNVLSELSIWGEQHRNKLKETL